MSNKGFVLRIYKVPSKLNKKNRNPILKRSKDLNRYFTKEDTQMVN